MTSTHVAICIPSGEMVHADFMLSLLHLAQQARAEGHRISVVNSKSSLITQGRNLAIDAALETKATRLLFLDSDMTFPPDTIPRLLGRERAIVGATYPRKGFPLHLIGTRLDGSELPLGGRGLTLAARLPTGCLMLDAKIFAAMRPPFFRCSYDETTGEILSEDFWFGERVRGLGYELWCDLDLSHEIEHLGTFRFSRKQKPTG